MILDEVKLKQDIKLSIHAFADGDIIQNTRKMLNILGYDSTRSIDLRVDYFTKSDKFDSQKAKADSWLNANMVFQITSEELTSQSSLFTFNFEKDLFQSFLFYAIELKPDHYTRTDLARITREINKPLQMPVNVLFKNDNSLTLAVIERRRHKRESSKVVLEKVTLIRNIDINDPHRAHIEILFDLSLSYLSHKYRFTNFEGLHKAWRETLDTKELNKRFYREISAWYFYAKSQVIFPDDVEQDADKRNSIALIRLITRLIFAWFIREKGLVPEKLFDEDFLKEILNYTDKTGSTYYKAILQNLFFATLNLEMNKDKPDSRKFVQREDGFHSDQHLQPAYRYARFFKEPEQALSLFENIPFLNGGLFENLDYEMEENGKRDIKRIDCFSDHPQNEEKLKVPDDLFFSELKKVDQCDVYGDKRHKSEEFRGIIKIFKRYKFTIEENTPIEEEIALDPELLGKVFENLLASYNPETHTTARKATGSFYTPREIVNYMVDESLVAYLETQLKEQNPELQDMKTLSELLRETLAYTEKAHPFKDNEIDTLINAINNCKILDPACGSGAFPMGILHKLVYLLHKLDPYNEKWMNRQIERVQSAIREAEKVEDTAIREHLLHDLEINIESIEDAFLNNELDYGRKLYLIENCIYGVDIQPIAIQIAKLRFFISLVIDQKVDPVKPNLNIRALPNLETKFVAANTLIGLDKLAQIALRNHEVDRLENELKEVRKNHFSARSRREKIRLRSLDEKLRNQIATLLIADGWYDKAARQLADWNPYNQSTSSPFFDPEWMFGIENGFNIVIGNPPYFNISTINKDFVKYLSERYKVVHTGYNDIVYYFIYLGVELLNKTGCSVLITSNYFLGNEYAKKLRLYLRQHISKVINFRDHMVFESASIHTCISVSYKEPKFKDVIFFKNNSDVKITSINIEEDLSPCLIKRESLKNNWIIADKSNNEILEKIKINAILLGNISRIKKGATSGDREIFTISKSFAEKNGFEKELLRTSINSKDIKRYILVDSEDYLIYNDNSIKIENYPNIYKYLLKYQEKLNKRNEVLKGLYPWYRLERPREKEVFDAKEKLVVPYRAEKNMFAYDNSQGFNDGGGSYAIIVKKGERIFLKYLLGILNSKLMDWFYGFIGKPKGKVREYFNGPLSLIPIKNIPPTEQQPIVDLVDQILSAKAENHEADTGSIEKQLDKMVYKLYELTNEEIAVVES